MNRLNELAMSLALLSLAGCALGAGHEVERSEQAQVLSSAPATLVATQVMTGWTLATTYPEQPEDTHNPGPHSTAEPRCAWRRTVRLWYACFGASYYQAVDVFEYRVTMKGIPDQLPVVGISLPAAPGVVGDVLGALGHDLDVVWWWASSEVATHAAGACASASPDGSNVVAESDPAPLMPHTVPVCLTCASDDGAVVSRRIGRSEEHSVAVDEFVVGTSTCPELPRGTTRELPARAETVDGVDPYDLVWEHDDDFYSHYR